ncbi:MAG: SPFH domain-containing protein [Oscillospiraceae bacterium]
MKKLVTDEKELKASSGWGALFGVIIAFCAALAGLIYAAVQLDQDFGQAAMVVLLVVCILVVCVGWIPLCGLKVIKPNEALVLTLFGKYIGTLKQDGFFYVNPFCTAAAPVHEKTGESWQGLFAGAAGKAAVQVSMPASKKISLKAMTLSSEKQKINDEMGNPIEVGIIVIWKVVNTAKAVFDVENYIQFIAIQADSVLRDVVRQYPYDAAAGEMSLRESSHEIAALLAESLQTRVESAGLEVIEARITHLAYSPEIAAAMLQRQQASAIVDARQKIVDGAVGMVEMALNKLSENKVCELDDERKAAMVSNLLVVLCGNKDAQPIVNSGSIY